MAFLGVVFTPVALCLPALISRYTSGPRPLRPFLKAMPVRIFMNLAFSAIILAMPGGAAAGRSECIPFSAS